MKRLFSIFLAIVMIVSAFPLQALAIEDSSAEREALLEQACVVFPEYESLIRCAPPTTYALPGSENEIIFTETRNVSDSERLTITQYSRGNILVLNERYSNNDLANTSLSSSNVGTDIIGYASFKAADTTALGYFTYDNVGFIITQGGSGSFTSYGTPNKGPYAYYIKSRENSTHISYNLTFDYTLTTESYYTFSLYFSNSQLHASLG